MKKELINAASVLRLCQQFFYLKFIYGHTGEKAYQCRDNLEIHTWMHKGELRYKSNQYFKVINAIRVLRLCQESFNLKSIYEHTL